MKKAIALLALLLTPATAWSADLAAGQNYHGTIMAVAPGFYQQVGVDLPDGWSCRNSKEIILLTSNPHYNDILAVLLTAQATRQNVTFPTLASNATSNGYCTISEASLGDFSPWPA